MPMLYILPQFVHNKSMTRNDDNIPSHCPKLFIDWPFKRFLSSSLVPRMQAFDQSRPRVPFFVWRVENVRLCFCVNWSAKRSSSSNSLCVRACAQVFLLPLRCVCVPFVLTAAQTA